MEMTKLAKTVAHLTQETQQTEEMQQQCVAEREQMADHALHCPKEQIPCTDCGEAMSRDWLSSLYAWLWDYHAMVSIYIT